MEIQSTFQTALADKNDLNYDSDESGKTKDTFKRPLSCLKCSKAFSSKWKFDCHERIHTGKKPFSCSQCEKKLSQPVHLKTHERIHTDEKPFSCSKCEKKFTDGST